MKKITVYEDQVQKNLGDNFGLFFEDLNHAADGGLYAEMVQNRSFEYCEIDREDYHALTAWEKNSVLHWEIHTAEPMNQKNPHYLHVETKAGGYIANSGYNSGISLEKGENYEFSLWARCPKGDQIKVKISVAGDSNSICERNTENSGAICTSEYILVNGDYWKKYQISLHAAETTYNGKLYLIFENAGCCELDMISLFPKDTFRGRKNGLRKDIAQALCEMHPKFLRFPGGCLTHIGSLDENARDSMYRWKNTIGPIEERPSKRNSWGYNQTLGLGYYEYFLFCEDIGAKPLPVLPGGFNPHAGEGVPLDKIDAWVQEALDLIEFANGTADTKWGSVRAQMGHEQPFGLEYLAIGNEEIGNGFYERYPYFHKAIRERYPQIKIINSAGPFSVGEGYEAGWASAAKYGSDLIDEHYYCSPEWFLANMHHYEDYDDKGTGVFLGEYASEGNTFYNALIEAAYMTHLERSRAVRLACYAPMLCNVDYVNWKPDLLWFDNHRILKTPNYYVQKLFMNYQGTEEIAFCTEELNEVIRLMEREKLDGDISIRGNDIVGEINNVHITNLDEELRTEMSDFAVNEDNAEYHLVHLNCRHYILEFSFKRTAGKKGLKIFFGKRNADNYFCWEFGGWDNWDCNVVSAENRKSSVISHRIFSVDEKEYHLKLEVDGCHIKTWINSEKFNDTVYRLPELEELYIAASKDKKNGTTILKAVNLTGDEKKVKLCIEGSTKKHLRVISLKGHGLTEENTFDKPDNIVPAEEEKDLNGNEIEYAFEPHSFSVLVFEQDKGVV